MIAKRYCLFAAAVVLACAGTGANAAGLAPPLTFCFENVEQRPWSMPDASGLNFDLLKQVEHQLGEHFSIVARPWKRCIEELRVGSVDGVIAAADSADRRAFAVVPTLADGTADPARAMFDDDIHVFLRVGGRASWDGKQIHSANGEVVVPSGYLVASILRQRGYVPKELVKSAFDGLRLLADGIYDVAVLQGIEASTLARDDPHFRTQVMQAPIPFELVHYHLMIGRPSYARDPRRIEAIWRAIATVRQSPAYRKLETAQGLTS